MSILSELSSLNPTRATVICLVVVTIFPPGILTIYVFNREWFMAMDIFKLVLLSVSISVSYILAFLFATFLPEMLFGKHENSVILAAAFWGVVLAMFSSFFCLLYNFGGTLKEYVSDLERMVIISFFSFLLHAIFCSIRRRLACREILHKQDEPENIRPKSEQAPTQSI